MILVDSSVWIDHLRASDTTLTELLDRGQILTHPCVVGEIALGSLRQRAEIIRALSGLPKATLAEHDEVMAFIDRFSLFARGIGYIDVHLLASVRLTPDAVLWTRDRRLHETASELAIAYTGSTTTHPR